MRMLKTPLGCWNSVGFTSLFVCRMVISIWILYIQSPKLRLPGQGVQRLSLRVSWRNFLQLGMNAIFWNALGVG